MPETDPVVRCELDEARVLTVWFDTPAKPVNTLSAAAWDGLEAALERIGSDRPVGVVLASAKPRSFIAGADLHELRALDDDALDAYLVRGQRLLDRLARLPVATVAAIQGDALGGGLEVALACRLRVAVDEPSVKLGLPETTLGLVPGWGGTLRLPRLVGLERGLTLLVTGRTIPPADAFAMGLVDRLAGRDELVAVARGLAAAPPPVTRPGADDQAARRVIYDRLRRSTRERSGDHLPAPLAVIDVVETGYESGPDASAVAERRTLVALRASPAGRNLLRLFFLRSAAKKTAAAAAAATPHPVAAAVVIGGGTMGAGIASALATAGIGVRVIEADDSAAAAARARLTDEACRRGASVVTDWSAVATADLVVEAVFEDVATKRAVWERIAGQARDDAVLATNTSSLEVAALASLTRAPARVIGLHFFNPVARMPLVEVVRTPQAAADAVATGVAVAASLGKTPIVCGDAPGFVVNRVLFPYLRAAVMAVEAADDVTAIDEAVRAWGMPMGPCALIDEIGLDVTVAIFNVLSAALGPAVATPPCLAAAVARGWLGRKSGRGFYEHPAAAGARPRVNDRWDELAAGAAARAGSRAPIDVERFVGPMANEARRVLAEGVVDAAETIDLATVLGIGFPAFRGGLATYAGLGPSPPGRPGYT